MKKLVAYSASAKDCARQIVQEAFDDILCGNFKIPTQKEMENSLKGFIYYDFDEYQKTKGIIAKHPSWDKEQVADELYKHKLRYDKEYEGNLMQAASEAITEIENLLSSLSDAIRAWKIKNLE